MLSNGPVPKAGPHITNLHISRRCYIMTSSFLPRFSLLWERQQKEQGPAKADFETVDLATATTTISRSIGPELIGNSFYQRLGFAEILADAGLSGESLAIAKATILAQLIRPGSIRKTHRWIKHNSSLSEMCGINLSKFLKDKVYKIADELFCAKGTIEPALFQASSKLFSAQSELFLFDPTNTYFEGSTKGKSLANYPDREEGEPPLTPSSLCSATTCSVQLRSP